MAVLTEGSSAPADAEQLKEVETCLASVIGFLSRERAGKYLETGVDVLELGI